MEQTKKRRRLLPKILLVLLILCVLFLLGVHIWHRAKIKQERKLLDAAGYRYAKAAGDYALGYCKSGNETGNHIIVALSGMGIHDYSVTLRPMTEYLEQENLFVYLDRAGYGISGDTGTPQTTVQVVEDYRTALQNAGIQPPYVLMPHSLGGVYATYWESTYPDEIEGVFFLDSTVLIEGDVFPPEETGVGVQDYFEAVCCKIGLQRLVLHQYYPALTTPYTKKQQALSEALNSYGTYTSAQLSESRLENENCRAAWESIVTNDIPKAYVNASWAIRTRAEFDEQYEWMNARLGGSLSWDEETLAEAAEELITQGAELTETQLMPYLEKLGNCECYTLPGSHVIYEQKPMQCAVLLSQFLATMDALP